MPGKGITLNTLISPEIVFRRALTLSEVRNDVTLETVLSRPVGAVPSALFHDDGVMRKTKKAELGGVLETLSEKHTQLPPFDSASTVYIRDAMAIIQATDGNKYNTFGHLAREYCQHLLSGFNLSHTVIDVFDRYDDMSVKAGERQRRASVKGSVTKTYQVIEGRAVPTWKHFLSVTENKRALIKFLGGYLCKTLVNHILGDSEKTVYLAGCLSDTEKVAKVDCRGIHDVSSWASNHEEADTRMLLHAIFADKSFGSSGQKGRIVIRSRDTDVLVLAIHYFPQLTHTAELWVQTGTVTSNVDLRRFVPVHEICRNLSPTVCKILPAAHALTGSDTTSALYYIGKKTMFSVIQKNPVEYAGLESMGTDEVDKAMKAARKLMANLYDPKRREEKSHGDLNKLRARLARRINAISRLPPCEDSFKEHTERSRYQTKCWMTSHVAYQDLGSPFCHGWKSEDIPVPIMYKGPMAFALLQQMTCTCAGRNVCKNNCMCFSQNMGCTEICGCSASDECANTLTMGQHTSSYESDTDSDDDV